MTIAFSLSAQATTYSVASLKGGYSFLVNRWTANVNANQLAAVGVATFDGAGNATESYTQMYGGVRQTLTASGTYTVKSNGTGTINWIDGTQVAITLNSPAAGLAHGMQFLQVNDTNNEVESGTAWLQSPVAQTYGVASIKGTFAFQGNLWTADPNQQQQGTVGTITYDGKGVPRAPIPP